MEISGIGQGLAEKIEEFIKKGRIAEYEKLKKACPVDLEHLTTVEGLGPKTIKTLYQKLRIKNLADLEKAAKTRKIEKIPHFGPKAQENILRGIEFVKGGQGRMLLGFVWPLARQIERRLEGLKGVGKAVIAGSLRRRKETIGDVDILAISAQSTRVMDFSVPCRRLIKSSRRARRALQCVYITAWRPICGWWRLNRLVRPCNTLRAVKIIILRSEKWPRIKGGN